MFIIYDNLRDNILYDMDIILEWLKKEGLIVVDRNCLKCVSKMVWV